jgi:hypothetical protein
MTHGGQPAAPIGADAKLAICRKSTSLPSFPGTLPRENHASQLETRRRRVPLFVPDLPALYGLNRDKKKNKNFCARSKAPIRIQDSLRFSPKPYRFVTMQPCNLVTHRLPLPVRKHPSELVRRCPTLSELFRDKNHFLFHESALQTRHCSVIPSQSNLPNCFSINHHHPPQPFLARNFSQKPYILFQLTHLGSRLTKSPSKHLFSASNRPV